MVRLETADYLAARGRATRDLARLNRHIRKADVHGDEDGAAALNEAYLSTYRERVNLDRVQKRAGR